MIDMEITLPQYAAQMIERLERAGFAAYAVGGCVRDSLMGNAPKDWDLATSALPEQTAALFRAAGYQVVETGLKHGTVTVIAEGHPIEVTTFRIDGGYSDNRHPDQVIFTADIHQDLKRRDFTVNAMAYHPAKGLIDDCGGQLDLARGIVRCVGAPDVRFEEDALRILRCLRFASVLGFTIDPKTARSAEKNAPLLRHIASERVQMELQKLLCGKNVRKVLEENREILSQIIPEIRPMFFFDQKNPHHYLDVWSHTIEALSNSIPEPIVRLALLFHDIGKPSSFSQDEKGIGHFYGHPQVSETIAGEVMRRLRFDNHTVERVSKLVRWHDCDILPETKAVKRWLNRLGEEGLRQLLAVKAADRGATNHKYENLSVLHLVEQKLNTVLEEGQCFQREQMKIDGNDLLDLGIPRGKEIGLILEELLTLVIEERLPNQRTALLNRARQIWQEKN